MRQTMYGNLSLLDGAAAMGEWYRLFLVPGAGHCAANPAQANGKIILSSTTNILEAPSLNSSKGPFPQTNLQVMIDWVEQDVLPVTLNATHLAGNNTGANAQLCAWPYRPLWAANGTEECVFDEASYKTWIYDLNVSSHFSFRLVTVEVSLY